MNTKTLLYRLWKDESGALLSSEVILVGSILVVGAVAGLTAYRDTVVSEFSDLALAIGSLNQSYCYGGTWGHCAWTSGSRFFDTWDYTDVPVAVCTATALSTEGYSGTGYGGGVGYGGGGGFTNIGARPPAPPKVVDFPQSAVSVPCPTPVSYAPAPCATPTPCGVAQPCATSSCGRCCVQIIVNGVELTTGCGVPNCPTCYSTSSVAPCPTTGTFTAVIPDGSLPPPAVAFTPVPHPTLHHHHGPRMESIVLCFNEVSDQELKDIQDADRVKVLRITTSKITNAGLASLSRLKNLEELYIVGGKINDEGLKYLRGLVHLRVIDIRGTEVTEEGLQRLAKEMPRLDDDK